MTTFSMYAHRTTLVLALAAALIALVAVLAGPAAAGGPAPLLKTAKVGGKTIVVDRQGRTLYVLTPETAKHVLCSASCLQYWPVTAAPKRGRLVAAKGISGKLGRLKRGASFQVTLRGLPLYTFIGDTRPGVATGEGAQSFGGTWHVATAR
jgi:predicted lipoprotein with Yx(FWY)xxD motif